MIQSFPSDWDLLTKINYLERKIILNSILYYRHDISPLPDSYYDGMCKQLVDYHHIYNRHGNSYNDSALGYVYYDFNGSTGFHLYDRLDDEDKHKLTRMTLLYLDGKEG